MKNPRMNVNSKTTTNQDYIDKALERGMAHCLSHQDGILVFQYILNLCHYQKPTVTVNPQTGEIYKESTVYYSALQGVWLGIRKLIPRDKKIQVELPEYPLLETRFVEEEEETTIEEEMNERLTEDNRSY